MNNEFNFQPYTSPAKGAQKDGYALASLVLGIVAVLCTCCCCASALAIIPMGICAILAIVFAFVSKKNSNGKMDKKAVAGLVLGIVAMVILFIFLVSVVGTYALIDSTPQEELLAMIEETYKPMFEGNEDTYNALVDAIKSIYAARGAQ
jgi:F0F1-type ATP synthase membrane subunit a